MFDLTYDLWKEIISEIVLAHQPLFEAMHGAAEDLTLTAALIEELKEKGELQVVSDPWEFKLLIDPIEDMIEGFIIYLAAEEPQELLEQTKAAAASEQGFSSEEIQGFEMEHGLNMQEEILVEMEETYGIQAEMGENELVYTLVIFDSQDIDGSQNSELVWQEDIEN